MEFRKADHNDVDMICSIIGEGREYLRQQGIDQWQSDFPDRRRISSDIDNGYAYVLTDDGATIGYSALIRGEDPSYLVIDGKWLTQLTDYLTVHRVALTSKVRGRGYGNMLFSYYREYALKNGIKSIRIDTHRDNIIMQKLILGNGFGYCGIITVADGTKRNAYELTL